MNYSFISGPLLSLLFLGAGGYFNIPTQNKLISTSIPRVGNLQKVAGSYCLVNRRRLSKNWRAGVILLDMQ